MSFSVSDGLAHKMRTMKSNVVGAAFKIFLDERMTGAALPMVMRQGLAGSSTFWSANKDEINDLVTLLHSELSDGIDGIAA